MTTCEGCRCDRPTVWAVPQSMEDTGHWCNKHAVRFSGYRERGWLPASSPQLTLEEVAHV